MRPWGVLAAIALACNAPPREAPPEEVPPKEADKPAAPARPGLERLAALQPVKLATDQPAASDVAVDATHIYWAHIGKPVVRRIPRAGGPIETLYEGQAEVGGLSIGLDADGVYFIEDFEIKRVPKAGGQATVVGSLASLPARMTADDDGAYAATDASVTFYPRRGGALVLARDREVWDVGVDATHVYWVSRTGVKRIPKRGGKVQVLANGTFRWCRITVSETEVAWGDAVLESVFTVPKAGGPARFVAQAWSMASLDLAVDRGAVWAFSREGRIEKLDPRTGDVATVGLTLHGGGPAGLAIAGDDVLLAYGSSVGRLTTVVPDGARVRTERDLHVAGVSFSGESTVMQDPGLASRWIRELEDVIVPDVRAGALGLRIVGSTKGVGEQTARARAQVVETVVREELGATPRIAIDVAPEGRQDVAIDLVVADVEAWMKPR